MAQAILLTGQERRRRWSSDDRLEILEAAFAPAANVSEVARRFDVSTGLLFTWRRQALSVKVGAAFVPATVLGVPGSGDGGAATIVVDFANGTKVRVASWAPCDFAAAVMRALNDPDQFERARLDCERPLRYAQGDAGSCSDCAGRSGSRSFRTARFMSSGPNGPNDQHSAYGFVSRRLPIRGIPYLGARCEFRRTGAARA